MNPHERVIKRRACELINGSGERLIATTDEPWEDLVPRLCDRLDAIKDLENEREKLAEEKEKLEDELADVEEDRDALEAELKALKASS